MVLRSVGVLSVAKIMGALYAVIGLIAGLILATIGMLGVGLSGGEGALVGMMFGIGGLIFAPIFYGILGFIAGAIGSAVYNIVAGAVGGIELDLQ